MKTDNPMLHEEIADTLTGRARTDARHALSVLSEAAGSPAGEEEVPPLPADLRDQWQGAYGGPAPAPAPAGARENWISRLAEIFTRPRIAWAGGLAAAAVLLVMFQSPEFTTTGPNGGGIVTRGGSHGPVTGTAARVIVIAPSEKAAALLAELSRAFPARSIERRDSAPSNVEGGAIVIDTAARTIRQGAASSGLKDDPLTTTGEVIMAIESLDEPQPH